jgi:glycosyltransferase involved in cell wall biosynthesis
VAAKLRQNGVVTAISLHVNDQSELKREQGHPALALGYEHVYDLFLPCSADMADWCHALGVPSDKLIVVPNAPGYELDYDIEEILARRATRRRRTSLPEKAPEPGSELRVLFLGRLDRQKGLDRLIAIIDHCRRLNLPVAWRIIGGSVIDSDKSLDAVDFLPLIEPPLRSAAELTAAYEWADVLLVPSLWEGLPLTILEAARLGVVPVASRVGAVEEAVFDAETGLLIDDHSSAEQFASDATAALRRLIREPDLLDRLSAKAAAGMSRQWEPACGEVIERLDELVRRQAESPLR